MRKKVLAMFLALGLLFSCIAVQAEEDIKSAACDHYFKTEVSDQVEGAYTHTYIAPGGVTKACDVTSGTRYFRVVCIRCGLLERSWSEKYANRHSTNHD